MLNLKLQRGLSWLALVVIVFAALVPMGAEARSTDNSNSLKPTLAGRTEYPIRHDTSPSQLRGVPMLNATETKPDRIPQNLAMPRKIVDASTIHLDGALQTDGTNKKYIDDPMPNLEKGLNGANQGTNRTVNGYGVLPPDTDGDVSGDHYIQVVNNVFTIWDLNQTNPYTGLPLTVYGPARISTLFTGFGGACELWDDGDPVVVYDHLADRWLITQFALANYPNPPFSECIAISATGDPLGAWYRYEYQFDVMNDYPKFGVWPDGYYMTQNQFDPAAAGSQWRGQGVAVLERDVMLTGGNARMVYFDTYAACTSSEPECVLGGMLPSDLDGPVPPAGEPNHFMQFDDDAWGYSPDQLQVWDFHVDWANTANSTFTHTIDLPVAAFDSEVCLGYDRNCIPQPGTAQGVDAISDRLMYRLQYRNFGTYQTIVANHTVDVNDVPEHAGVRWYELRKVNGIWSVFQQSTYSPDAAHRWMGSIAMDGSGNIALGYSVSDGISIYPGINYAGRHSVDPVSTLPQGESVIILGTGSQTHSAARWGDYSAMTVNPQNDCQFWYTQEWNRVTSSAEWYTYIAAFSYPAPTTPGAGDGCTPHSPFLDVNDSQWFAPFVYRMYDLGLTTGCGGGNFCPMGNVTRAETAVFLLRAIHGSTYVPPAASGTVFGDVPAGYWAAAWIEELAAEGIAGGCGGGNFCPNNNVNRAELSVFILLAEHGSGYTPPAASGTVFNDVPAGYWAAAWIEQLAAEGVTGGCGGGNFCPTGLVTRAQISVFLIKLIELLP
jgi:hypothetical protein